MSTFRILMQGFWALINLIVLFLLVVGWFWHWTDHAMIGLLVLWVFSMQHPSTMVKVK